MSGNSHLDDSNGSVSTISDSEESIEKTNVSEVVDFPFYLFRPMVSTNFSILDRVESNFEECKAILDDLTAKGPIEDDLSGFIGTCAGIPVDEDELINDVQKGLKSYEKGVNEYCSLQSAMKRKQTNTYLCPLESSQLDGFQLLAPKPQVVPSEMHTMTDLTNKSDKRKRGAKKMTEKKEQKVEKIKLLRTANDVWDIKEQPQKIVPIYSEQISGKPKRRNSLM